MSEIALYKALLEANVSEDLAEQAVKGLVFVNNAAPNVVLRSDLAAFRADLRADNVALRSDLAAMRSDLAAMRSDLRADLATLRSDLRADMAALRDDIARLEIKFFRLAITLTAIIIIAIGLMIKFL